MAWHFTLHLHQLHLFTNLLVLDPTHQIPTQHSCLTWSPGPNRSIAVQLAQGLKNPRFVNVAIALSCPYISWVWDLPTWHRYRPARFRDIAAPVERWDLCILPNSIHIPILILTPNDAPEPKIQQTSPYFGCNQQIQQSRERMKIGTEFQGRHRVGGPEDFCLVSKR